MTSSPGAPSGRRTPTVRRWTILALVFLVAGAVLVESWHAAMNAATTGGRPWPWLWPVTLEAFIFVLVLVYWDARSEGQRAWTARVFLFLTTAVASAVQILDAPPTWLGWVTAGWTPVALLLAVEFAVGRLYRPDWSIPDPPAEPAPAVPDPEPVPEVRPRPTQDAARRSGPVGRGRPSQNGTGLIKADRVALYRAAKKGPAEVERIMVRRGLDRSVVAAYPERWPLPSQNGNGA